MRDTRQNRYGRQDSEARQRIDNDGRSRVSERPGFKFAPGCHLLDEILHRPESLRRLPTRFLTIGAIIHCGVCQIIVVISQLVDRSVCMAWCDATFQQLCCQRAEIRLTHWREPQARLRRHPECAASHRAAFPACLDLFLSMNNRRACAQRRLCARI